MKEPTSKKTVARKSSRSTASASLRSKNSRASEATSSLAKSNSSANSAWISDFAARASVLEEAVHRTLLARPLVSTAVALGAGLLANLAWKQWGESQKNSGSGKSSAGRKILRAGFLSGNISTTLDRLQSEFDTLSFGRLEDARESVVRVIADELKRHPFETLATAAGIGFGLADFDRRHLKTAGVKFVKLAALRALDYPSENASTRSRTSTPTQTGGDLYV